MTTPRPIQRRETRPVDDVPAAVLPLIARLYATRGATDAADFSLGLRQLVPVSELARMDAAVDLVCKHREGRILIVGDFDADGATSTALVIRCLGRFGFADLDYLVPNRFEFGYGLSYELAIIAIASEPTLIVTVDNGISSVAGVRAAIDAGIDVLVTDHHLPPDELPPATVILNPNMPDDNFPSKSLAGVGVCFCLLAAVGRRLEDQGETGAAKVAAEYLDLVALGTVADVVPLDRNNRILIHQGLMRIRAARTVPGILALLAEAGRDHRQAVASDLAFAVGPRLNAAGRLEDMSVGIETLLCDSPEEARTLAARLAEINKNRRQLESSMQDDALQSLATMPGGAGDERELPSCLSLYDSNWHQGIVGLVASRIKERTHRPVFAFATAGENALKGSGRSIGGVHLRDLLAWVDSRWPGMITRFGGHAMAAGLTLPLASFDAFADRVDEGCATLFPDADFQGRWLTDGELGPEEIALDLAQSLRDAGPWGQSFPEPVFDGRFRLQGARIVGEKHLKLRVQPIGSDAVIDGIAFGQADCAPLPAGCRLELVYRVAVNDYRGLKTVQLMVEQISVLQ